jgi:hypothetical protein
LKISKVLQQKGIHIWLFFLGIAVIEMSQSSWLVAGVLPGIERQPRKKLEPSPERLLALLHGWRAEAVGAGKEITRIAVAFESPFLQRRVSELSVPVRQVKLTAERRGDRGVPEKVRRWRTYDRGEVHPREEDGAVGCNPEVPLLALAFRKDDMLAGEPAGRQPQEQ